MYILTFDIEEWFHILDNESTRTEKEWSRYERRLSQNIDRIFELLERKKQKATFFCLGWIARKYPDIVKKIVSLRYDIGTHSDMHQLVYAQSKEDFSRDLEFSIKSIEDITGKKVKAYRAPGFSIKTENKWLFEILLDMGIEIDCSIFPTKGIHGGIENFGVSEPFWININGQKIKEFPINLYKIMNKDIVFSGGGYFRFFPYWLIKRFMKKSNYVMTFFHYRDFDPKQPMIKELSFIRKIKSYYGLKSAFTKLEKLLDDFEFIDLHTADKIVDWNVVRVVNF